MQHGTEHRPTPYQRGNNAKRGCRCSITGCSKLSKMIRIAPQCATTNFLDLLPTNIVLTKKNRHYWYISCHHFDRQVFDASSMIPFAYIKDRTIAERVYGKEALKYRVVDEKTPLWYVVPTNFGNSLKDLKNTSMNFNASSPPRAMINQEVNLPEERNRKKRPVEKLISSVKKSFQNLLHKRMRISSPTQNTPNHSNPRSDNYASSPISFQNLNDVDDTDNLGMNENTGQQEIEEDQADSPESNSNPRIVSKLISTVKKSAHMFGTRMSLFFSTDNVPNPSNPRSVNDSSSPKRSQQLLDFEAEDRDVGVHSFLKFLNLDESVDESDDLLIRQMHNENASVNLDESFDEIDNSLIRQMNENVAGQEEIDEDRITFFSISESNSGSPATLPLANTDHEEETLPLANTDEEEEVISGVRNYEFIQALDEKIKKDGNNVATIEYRYGGLKNQRKGCRSYFPIKRNMSNEKEIEVASMNKTEKDTYTRNVRGLSAEMQRFLMLSAGEGNEILQHDVLRHLNHRQEVKDIYDRQLGVYDCIAIREEAGAGVSTNQINRTLDACAILRGTKKPHLFRTSQLRSKIGKVEKEELLNAEYFTLDAEIDGKKMKNCVFWYIPQVPLLCERLLTSAHCDGKYEESERYSNLEDYVLYYRGVDRGGGDNIELIRLGNRIDGNSGMYCVPVSNLEGGGETYSNMQLTCFHKERNLTFDMLQKEQLHTLLLTTSCRAFKCILIEFSCDDIDLCSSHNLKVEIKMLDVDGDLVLENEASAAQFESDATNGGAEDRVSPDTIKLTSDQISSIVSLADLPTTKVTRSYTHLLSLSARFVSRRTENTDTRIIVGLQLLSEDVLLYSFLFDAAITTSNETSTTATIDCRRAISKFTNDAKLNNTVLGLSSCGVKYACPYCTLCMIGGGVCLPKWLEEFAKHQMNDWDQSKFGENPLCSKEYEDKYVEAQPRTGENSFENSWMKFKEIVGENKEASSAEAGKSQAQTQAEEKSKSVSQKPLLCVDDPLNSMPPDSLHTFEGVVNHLTEDVMSLLPKVELDADPLNASVGLQSIKESSNQILKQIQKAKTYKEACKYHTVLKKTEQKHGGKVGKLKTDMGKVNKESDAWNVMADELNLVEAELKEIELEIRSLYSAESVYGLGNRTLRGLKRFEKLIAKELTEFKKGEFGSFKRLFAFRHLLGIILTDTCSSIPHPVTHVGTTKGAYLFKTILQTVAGHFKKEHGGMKLNAARCLLAMQRRDVINKVMNDAYKTQGETQANMLHIIDWWYQCSRHLYEIGLLLKSQKKMTTSRCDKLRREAAFFLAHYLRMTPKKNPTYYKLHVFLFHLIDHAEKTGICGHARCEGFENTHYLMNVLRAVMKTIPSTSQRVQKLAHRTQIFLIHEVEKRRRIIAEKKKKPGERGLYNVERKFKYQEDINDMTSEANKLLFKISDQEIIEVVEIEDSMLLPVEFLDTYYHYAKNKANPSNLEAIEESEELGNKVKREARFM